METKKLVSLTMIVAAGCLLVFTGCNKEKPVATNPSGTSAVQAPPGTFTVKMTDSPGDYAALRVNITKVEARVENGSWVNLNNQAQTVDVLSLTNGIQVQLAQATSIKAGAYTRLKISFGHDNYIRFNTGANLAGISLNAEGEALLTWEGPHEVEIDINHNINAKTGATVLLDFNVAQSITREAGQCIFHPLITEIEDLSTGVQGEVNNSTAAAIILTDGVYNYSTYLNAAGQFLLQGIDPGTYDLIIVPAGESLNGENEHRLEGIQVMDGHITQMGSIHL